MLLYRFIYGNNPKIAISRGVRESLYEFSRRNIRLITDGIDLHYRPKQDQGVIQCLMFGNHFFRKGVDLGIKSVIKANEYSNGFYTMNIITENPKNISDYFRQVFGDKGFQYVHFLNACDDISDYYNNADVLLALSREERLIGSMIEALYMNCDVIATNISGHNDIADSGIIWVDNPNNEDIEPEVTNELLNLQKANVQKPIQSIMMKLMH